MLCEINETRNMNKAMQKYVWLAIAENKEKQVSNST